MSAAHTGTAASRNGIDLIDKDDTRSVFLRILKKIADTGSADTDEHLDEIRSGDRKERNSRLTGNRLREKCLTGSRRSYQDHALRDPGTDIRIFLRIFQEINDLFQFFLLLLESCDLGEVHGIRPAHLRAALSKIHHLGVSAAAPADSRVHEHKHEHDHNGAQSDRDNDRHQVVLLRDILNDVVDGIVLEKFFRVLDIGYCNRCPVPAL